jgi:transcriptional regulator with XRE-family HTH domain
MLNSAKIIREIRIQMCLEQEKFANLLGITKASVCNYEAGRNKPKLSVIKKIREVAKENGMDIPVKDFLR